MSDNTQRLMRRGLFAAIVVGALASASVASAAGPGLSHYSVHTDDVVVEHETADENSCNQEAVITLHRHVNASLATTQSGLDTNELIALLSDDPDGILRQLAMVATGDITIEMGGHTYVGTFTQRFDGRFLTNGMYLQSGSVAVTARSEDGALLTLHAMGNDVDDFDGTTKHAFSRGKMTGDCP